MNGTESFVRSQLRHTAERKRRGEVKAQSRAAFKTVKTFQKCKLEQQSHSGDDLVCLLYILYSQLNRKSDLAVTDLIKEVAAGYSSSDFLLA